MKKLTSTPALQNSRTPALQNSRTPLPWGGFGGGPLLNFWTPALLICALPILLLVLENDLLWKAQELNLFLNTRQFFNDQMVVPGGLLTWMGTFFTQFFYYPWLGVLFLAAWWVLLTWLIKKTFKFQFSFLGTSLLAILPIVFILATVVDLGYWIYILKLRGHFFVTTIGATAVTALLWAFRTVCKGRGVVECLFPLLTCAITYPLLGIYGLVATLLMGIWIWRLQPRRLQALCVSITALAAVVCVPLFCYHFVYHQTNYANIWFAELPLFFILERFQYYYIPFWLLLAYYVIMVVLPCPSRTPAFQKSRTPLPWGGVGGGLLLQLALLGGSVYFVVSFWYRDKNYHHELAMQRSIERLDWQGVLDIAADQDDEPTRSIVVMRNLALARLGRQGNEMYHYLNGSKEYNFPFQMRLLLVAGQLVYYHYGLPNLCYRLSTEMGVEYGWRAEHLKYLTRCALLNGEWQLARKYIAILSNTTFHRSWAERFAQLIGTPDAVAKSDEMAFPAHMLHYNDALANDQGFPEDFVMNRLSASSYTGDTVFQEQALLASLYTKDTRHFWRHLSDYARLHPGEQLPIHVQEAAIHFGTIEGRGNVEEWPFDPSVKETFRRFVEVTPQFNKMEAGAIRRALYPQFGKTYYYDYYLMSNLPQY